MAVYASENILGQYKSTHYFTLFLGRDHCIQTMVRTITYQVPLVSDKAMSARVTTTVDKIYQ
jgi:hypothetical protein